MTQSPETSAGSGFTFENNIATYYLTKVLTQNTGVGLNNGTPYKVSTQQKDFNEPLDDIIIHFKTNNNSNGKLSLQVKKSLTISNAKSNTDFKDIIEDSYTTFKDDNFNTNIDCFGCAVSKITQQKLKGLTDLCNWAKESDTPQHFKQRFSKNGNANKTVKTIKSDIEAILKNKDENIAQHIDILQ